MADPIEDYKDIEIAPEEEVNPPEGYTVQEWTNLSAAEREVALEEIANPEGKEAEEDEETLKAIAGEDDEAKKKAEEEAETAKASEEAKAKADAEAIAKAGEKPPETPPAETVMSDEDLLSHRFVIETKIDPDEKVPIPDDLQGKLDDLEEKFDTGDIDQKEYNSQVREIDRQATARFMQSKDHEKTDLLWNQEQGLFLRNRPEYLGEKKEDGTFDKSPETIIRWNALSGAVQALQDKSPNLSGMRLLIEADKMVKKMFGGKSEAAPAKKEDAPPKKDAKPPAKMPEDFVSIGDLPAAGKESTEGTFDQLDKLSGKALENYMKKHPDLADRYINDLGRA